MNALILVDIQNDFLPGGALAVPRGDEVIPVANRLQRRFDLVVATQDWHPADHASFAANHFGRRVGEVIDLEGLEQVLWPVHCVQDSSGAEFAQELDRDRAGEPPGARHLGLVHLAEPAAPDAAAHVESAQTSGGHAHSMHPRTGAADVRPRRVSAGSGRRPTRAAFLAPPAGEGAAHDGTLVAVALEVAIRGMGERT